MRITQILGNQLVNILTCFSVLGSRLAKATSVIGDVAAYISRTTCVNWRLKTDEDQNFVRFFGNTAAYV
jgi:hypothetical protein